LGALGSGLPCFRIRTVIPPRPRASRVVRSIALGLIMTSWLTL
jgi:hypothetical protein